MQKEAVMNRVYLGMIIYCASAGFTAASTHATTHEQSCSERAKGWAACAATKILPTQQNMTRINCVAGVGLVVYGLGTGNMYHALSGSGIAALSGYTWLVLKQRKALVQV